MKLKFGRRNFLKGLLLATAGAAILAPQALIEPVHGASDLTPQERDIAADVMGLRRETWAGWNPFHYVTVDNGARWPLKHFDLSRPEPNVEWCAEFKVTTFRGGWSGSLSVDEASSALLADVIQREGMRGQPEARIKVVAGDTVVFDELARISQYGLGDGLVTLGFAQVKPSPDYTTVSRW